MQSDIKEFQYEVLKDVTNYKVLIYSIENVQSFSNGQLVPVGCYCIKYSVPLYLWQLANWVHKNDTFDDIWYSDIWYFDIWWYLIQIFVFSVNIENIKKYMSINRQGLKSWKYFVKWKWISLFMIMSANEVMLISLIDKMIFFECKLCKNVQKCFYVNLKINTKICPYFQVVITITVIMHNHNPFIKIDKLNTIQNTTYSLGEDTIKIMQYLWRLLLQHALYP